MSDFLSRLAIRARGEAIHVEPLIGSRHEAAAAAAAPQELEPQPAPRAAAAAEPPQAAPAPGPDLPISPAIEVDGGGGLPATSALPAPSATAGNAAIGTEMPAARPGVDALLPARPLEKVVTPGDAALLSSPPVAGEAEPPAPATAPPAREWPASKPEDAPVAAIETGDPLLPQLPVERAVTVRL